MSANEAGLPLITLGWELEAITRAHRHVKGVECAHDGSVAGEGLEYRVRRELVFEPNKSLAALRVLATDPYLQVDASCGFHVHVGLGNRTRRMHDWACWFVTLARDTEAEAFNAVPTSRRDNRYCRSWHRPDASQSLIAQQYSSDKGSNRDRYNWVNPVEIFRPGGIRTIEVRLMGHCKRYTYLLAWISVCRMMAQSAWALTFDPSRLEAERVEIKKAWGIVKDNFLARVPPATVARTALYLAAKGGLSEPFGKPLAKLSKREAEIAYEAQQVETDRKEYESLLKSMRQAVDEYRARVVQTGEPPVGVLLPGDTVECTAIRGDMQGVMTVGRQYRVLSAWEGGCCVVNDDGVRWNITAQAVRLSERAGVQACAV